MQDTPLVLGGTSDELVIGYAPAFRGATGWTPVFRQRRLASRDVVVRRVTFANTSDPHSRLAVDVAEAPTQEGAHARLAAATVESNLVFETGPAYLGPSSFVHPKVKPRSVYFSRANLTISVVSCGRTPIDVQSWADLILQDLEPDRTTGMDSALVLEPDPQPIHLPQATRLRFSLPWDRGEWAWWKFKAQGGTLTRTPEVDTDRLLFWPHTGQTGAMVTGWSTEPGRETYWGRYSAHP